MLTGKSNLTYARPTTYTDSWEEALKNSVESCKRTKNLPNTWDSNTAIQTLDIKSLGERRKY